MLVGGFLIARGSSTLGNILDVQSLEATISQFGVLGPISVITLMTLAIVMSPIPSAPIALASGAVYGHYWGAIYVTIGAELGALVAFGLARFIGLEAVQKWLGTKPSSSFLNRFMQSQNALTVAVFATRLMPFLSFDIISYAAGLTPLKAWRFAIATLLGIAPASFALAHFGGTLTTGDLGALGLTVLFLGSITLIPVIWKMAPPKWRTSAKQIFRIS